MKRLLLGAALALSVPACTAGSIVSAPPPNVVVSRTVADEKVLTLLAQSLTATALASSALVKVGVIEAGSPRALSLAANLDLARDLINAAASARTATSYSEALVKIGPVIASIQSAISGAN